MGRTPIFDLAAVESAGLEVAAERGWAAISMRSVAEQLGVSTMALYRVTPDATALRRAVADRAAARLRPRTRLGSDVVDELGRWAPMAHRRLIAHPGLAAFVVANWTELPRWLDIVESFLDVAEAEDRPPMDAVAVVNAVFAFVLARAQFRDSIREADPRRLGPLRAEPARYPNIARSRAAFSTARTSKHFQIGLDALVAGLR
jgi:AcrR family transcriptional regulator